MRKRALLPMAWMLAIGMSYAEGFPYKAKVIGTDDQPIEGAVVFVSEKVPSALTGKDGQFEIKLPSQENTITVSAEGYFPFQVKISDKKPLSEIILVNSNQFKYKHDLTLPFGEETRQSQGTNAEEIRRKELLQSSSLDQALQGELSGLQVIQKSGMPGEGAYLNFRGIHSLTAENMPLIVVNGIPYFGNDQISATINGYSRSLLAGLNVADIRSITLVKGADAALYGSLGSNGVLLIETEQAKSDKLDTRISFNGQYGLNLRNREIPMLNSQQYSDYLRDIGMTRYNQMNALVSDYPFLQSGTDYYYHYIFNNNTNWQDEIYNSAFTTNNVFRVEGGDEVAKYNLSVGYTNNGGTLKETYFERYNTLLNSNIMVSRKVDIFANIGLSYMKNKLQEQGMYAETNPLLAAYYSMPLLNPYIADDKGELKSDFAPYNFWNVNKNPQYPYENTSNALAIVKTLEADDKVYDVMLRAGLNYKPNAYLTFNGLFNLQYRYIEENIFIPGATKKTILPQYYGIGENTVRKGATNQKSLYYGLTGTYKRTFDDLHAVNVQAGTRLMTHSLEYDMTTGFNTANDFYQTLDKVNDEVYISGFNRDWVWVNNYVHADYTFNRMLKASANLAVDGSSVSGKDAARFYLYPSAGITFMAAEAGFLPSFFNLLNLRAEYGLTGNSRISSNYSKIYYQNANYFTVGTITRWNIANTELEPEKKRQFDLSLDMSLFKRRIDLSVNYFNAIGYDLLINQSPYTALGSRVFYENAAQIGTNGIEASIRAAIVETKDFGFLLGGNIATANSKVLSLGNRDEMVLSYDGYNNGDDAQVILRVGESPYQFFGYKTNGVYATQQQASEAGLINIRNRPYQAGDVIFVNQNEDNKINEKDKVLLGTAAPDFFGDVFAQIRYRQLTLTANFRYSVGNMAYNAVRRELESMDNFYNQTTAIQNRWQDEGQKTDIPRAVYGDPSGNNIFSDRWIEDASYIKLRSLTLNYHFNKTVLKLFRSGDVWVSAENLFCITKYLGVDPEFSYSYNEAMQGFDYGKVPMPRTIRIGFNLNF